ncbi:MAG: hypothetical protein ACLQKA_07250, partial [Bryobacteraceae bacterium]
MTRSIASLFFVSCLLAAPLLAQTTIGGGTCNSASLDGVYDVSITSRQVSATGTFTGVFQSTGLATFDGLSAVTIGLTSNTGQVVGTALTWSGSYSVQANCAGVINITSGGSATLHVALYDQGNNFLLSGSDAANYVYSGSGVTQPTTAAPAGTGCSASTFSGVYTFNGTGFALTGTAVSGAENGSGLLEFDGVSKVTVNVTMSALGAAPSALTLTGMYSISSNCLGLASLTDTSNNSYEMNFSIYNTSAANGAENTMSDNTIAFLLNPAKPQVNGNITVASPGGHNAINYAEA